MGRRKGSEAKDDILLAWNFLEAAPEIRITVQVGHLEVEAAPTRVWGSDAGRGNTPIRMPY